MQYAGLRGFIKQTKRTCSYSVLDKGGQSVKRSRNIMKMDLWFNNEINRRRQSENGVVEEVLWIRNKLNVVSDDWHEENQTYKQPSRGYLIKQNISSEVQLSWMLDDVDGKQTDA